MSTTWRLSQPAEEEKHQESVIADEATFLEGQLMIIVVKYVSAL